MHSEVHAVYRSQKVDGFILLSDSEGIPVSIMEALSYGIPVIATDTGGVSEIVTDTNGILLPSNPEIGKIASAINGLKNFRNREIRAQIKEQVYLNYAADKNFPEFIKAELAGSW
jgi:glycosyltransferase involved in cell wall biosynthesis